MIEGLMNSGSVPVLERMFQFSGQRHRLLTNNIANIDTPFYQMKDVSTEAFQAQLGDAIDERRASKGAMGSPLPLSDSAEVQVSATGLRLVPQASSKNIMFHDQNDRDLERMMQAMTENFMTFRAAAEFMKRQFAGIESAIQERP